MTTEVNLVPFDNVNVEAALKDYEINNVMAKVSNIQRGFQSYPEYRIPLSDRFGIIERKHFITVKKQTPTIEEKRIVKLVENENAAAHFSPLKIGATDGSAAPEDDDEQWW